MMFNIFKISLPFFVLLADIFLVGNRTSKKPAKQPERARGNGRDNDSNTK